MKFKNIKEKLLYIQTNLKAPKGQTNSFGGYRYRSCEDILEAVKPLLKETRTIVVISDGIENVGGETLERFYIQATATLKDCDTDEQIPVSALAREPVSKKGMDEAQITGSTSSYARKYALNGLFAIDDTKDADTMDNTAKTAIKTPKTTDFDKAKKAIKNAKDKEALKTAVSRINKSTKYTKDEKAELEKIAEEVIAESPDEIPVYEEK